MKNKRKWNKVIYLGLIFILTSGLILSPAGKMSVYAEEAGEEDDNVEEPENPEETGEDSESPDQESEGESDESGDESDESEDGSGESDEPENGGNSGGFIIESEKVEGDMDVLGALEGKIDITEGKIEGLTITKRLETGDERDPLVIQITSPGPVDVVELKTQTMDGGPPDFDLIEGICESDTPGWACLEDVTMEVDHQDVENISLPDAEIVTCFEEECDNLPGETSSTDKDEIQTMMEKMEKQELTLEEIMKGLEDDREKLDEMQELLEQASDTYDQMQDEQQVEELANVIEEIAELLDESEGDQGNEESDNEEEGENNGSADEGASADEPQSGEEDAGDNQSEEEADEETSADQGKSAETNNDENPLVNLTEKAGENYQAFDDISSK